MGSETKVKKPEPGVYDPHYERAAGIVCLCCSETSGYKYVVTGGGFLCPPCAAFVAPERMIGVPRDQMEELLSRAERSDEEWEAIGWRPDATVTVLEPQS